MVTGRLLVHFGIDALLAEARARVLEEAGYEVIVTETRRGALRILRGRSVDLVLACHSVPPDELEGALREIRRLKPPVPVVVVHVGGLVRPQRSLADGFVDGLRGPEHLLSQVAAILARSGTAAAAS
jgi:DNA-binding response OmpR family regulator